MTEDKKVAIITGASQGIGAAIVEGYLKAGFRVVATSRSIKPSDSPDVVTISGDIGSADTAKRVVEAALKHFGRVDTLINNAGIFVPSPFTQYSAEQYEQVLSTNVNGFFHMTQAALTVMEKSGRGHVLSITTSLVDHPFAEVPSVLASLSKGGINAASRSLAIEYARRGIRVNTVSPGIINTPMHAPETHDFLSALHPMGHMGETADIVDAVLYLEGAAFVTGENLHVDGGQAAGR